MLGEVSGGEDNAILRIGVKTRQKNSNQSKDKTRIAKRMGKARLTAG
jgi:hypothetical protein